MDDQPGTSRSLLESDSDDDQEQQLTIDEREDRTILALTRQLNDSLEAKARQHNMTAMNVKSFLKVSQQFIEFF